MNRLATVSMLFAGAVVTTTSSDRVDEYVRSEMAKQKIPGLSLAVVLNGTVERAKGYGLANVELQAPATEHTVYQSGSVGKQFTAAAVMLLVEEGKLGLDEPIGRYLAGAPASWTDITVRHLLTHTSGIKDYTDTDRLNYRLDYTDDELVRMAAGLPSDFAPGTKWAYSNTGYLLLGQIVNRVAGQFYGDLLADRVFGPLGMQTARVISEADIIPNRSAGYRLVNGEWKNQDYVSPSLNRQADGSLYLTVLDLVRWDKGLAERRLFKPSSYDVMWTPVRLKDGTSYPYGFGWELSPVNGHRVVMHTGSWQGFQAHISRFIDDHLSVIVMINSDTSEPEQIAHGVAALFVPDLRKKP